jgi:hypothetical protein
MFDPNGFLDLRLCDGETRLEVFQNGELLLLVYCDDDPVPDDVYSTKISVEEFRLIVEDIAPFRVLEIRQDS